MHDDSNLGLQASYTLSLKQIVRDCASARLRNSEKLYFAERMGKRDKQDESSSDYEKNLHPWCMHCIVFFLKLKNDALKL